MSAAARIALLRRWTVGDRVCTLTLPAFKAKQAVQVRVTWSPVLGDDLTVERDPLPARTRDAGRVRELSRELDITAEVVEA